MINYRNFLLLILCCNETELALNETIFCLFIKHGLNKTSLLHSFFSKRKSDEYFLKYKGLDYISNNVVGSHEQEYVINWNNPQAKDFFNQLESKIESLMRLKKGI